MRKPLGTFVDNESLYVVCDDGAVFMARLANAPNIVWTSVTPVPGSQADADKNKART
jgi:hypothetical protein